MTMQPRHEGRLERAPSRGLVGGVCAGIGDYLGIPPIILRAAFAILAAWRMTGVWAYFLVWIIVPLVSDGPRSPGLEAHTHQGLRTDDKPDASPKEWWQVPVVGLLGAGAFWLIQSSASAIPLYWFAAESLLAVGMGLIWWQADHASTLDIVPTGGPRGWIAPLLKSGTTVLALVIGLAFDAGAVIMAALRLPAGDVGRTLAGIALAVGALLASAAPWLLRVRRSLTEAREAKLVADARADMAAHLHDSVLQTLALIQKRADDPRAVTRLARRQERELRTWLYGEPEKPSSLAAALKAAAASVEDDFDIEIEVVTVGDADLSDGLAQLVASAREAMVNAAKHSGAPRVDVYAEAFGGDVTVFVRDRGHGFDTDAIPDGRMGVRHSILERMERYGGRARVRSDSSGTEVTLEMSV